MGVETLDLWIDRDDTEIEFHGCIGLQVPEEMQQREGILAAGNAEQQAVSVANHVEIRDRLPHLAQQGLGRFHKACHSAVLW